MLNPLSDLAVLKVEENLFSENKFPVCVDWADLSNIVEVGDNIFINVQNHIWTCPDIYNQDVWDVL
mgnify:CR=1 FL=1